MSSLESLLKPMKWLDREIQAQYTKLGRKIPEDKLYKITTVLGLLGTFAGCKTGFLIPESYRTVESSLILGFLFGVGVVGTDFEYNLAGLNGLLGKNSDGEVVSVSPYTDFCVRNSKAMRLPVFLTGIGLLGKSIYDVANYFVNKEPLTESTVINTVSGVGFLSLASSMYLKDQDPKLLKKSPSKLKTFLASLYSRAKESLALPAPKPIPVKYLAERSQ